MPRPQAPDPRALSSLLEILEVAAERYGDSVLLALRTDQGTQHRWSARELLRRSKLVAWRLRELGLEPGDRLLTWSPSTPELPAVYFGAIRAGVIVVPIDLRMAPDVVRRIAERAEARVLAIGTGQDAPDATAAGIAGLTTRTLDFLASDPPHQSASGRDEGGLDDAFPADWETRLDGWTRPTRSDLFEIVYTSGTTGYPKGVELTHGNILATIEGIDHVIPPRHHRLVSLLPLSHLFEQAPVLFYALMVGAEIAYVRSRNPRVIFEALRDQRVTTLVVVPLLLELFWNALRREIDRQGKLRTFDRVRSVARHLPWRVRRFLFRRIHRQLGGELALLVSAAAYLPPELARSWHDLGIPVLQGYGATECGVATATEPGMGLGTVGKPVPPGRVRLAEEDREILVSGPAVFAGYWRDPDATAAALDPDGWYHTGDIGEFDREGNLVLKGRKKNIIVLPNGLNVFPEDIENELALAGLPQAVVVETKPGRIEAVVLPPGTNPAPNPGDASKPAPERTPEEWRELEARIESSVKEANGRLGIHQRVVGWRLWPQADFPRTHTLKIRRDPVRAWAAADAPLPVRQEESRAAVG